MGKKIYNNDDEYEYYKKPAINKAVFAFLATLFLMLIIGIPALLIISGKSKDVKVAKLNTEGIASWEIVPELLVAEDKEEIQEEEEVEIVIPEEDADYTHIIETANPDELTISFAGDILFDTNYAVGNAFNRNGNSAVGIVGDSLLTRMRTSDIMLVNNEFPYSEGGAPTEGKTYTFRARPGTAQILKDMGVDIVGLANNHAYDYGEQALLDTLDTLDGADIEYVGAGRNIDEASHPVYYIAQNGMKIAIICATQIERLSNPDTKEATATSPGVFRCLDDTKLLERIREAKEKDAFVIVFIHWGTEGTNEIDYLQRDQSAEIASAGADLIIGAHPHVLQKIDYVNGVPVVFSLGNYIFNSKTLDTCLITATIRNDRSVTLQMIPAVQQGCTVKEAFGGEAQRIFDEMSSMSPGINIDSNGFISR
ncbi:MAG: CapA family protein [Butyrivibrio sp.]|nr:CapA family protein [Butyrivibrio sp.]